MIKFKFLHFSLPEEYIDLGEYNEYYKEVDNPIGIQNLPNGEYMIRGNKKGHRKEYYHINNTWFLVSDVTKDNGHNICDATRYMLFPSLPEKQWNAISKAGWRRLNKTWQRYLFAYYHWQDLLRIQKDMGKLRIQLKDL